MNRARWWINLYPQGDVSGRLFVTRQDALNACEYFDGKPIAEQVEVEILRVDEPPFALPFKAITREEILDQLRFRRIRIDELLKDCKPEHAALLGAEKYYVEAQIEYQDRKA